MTQPRSRRMLRLALTPRWLLGLGLLEFGAQLRDVAVQRLLDQTLLLGADAGAELLAGEGVLQPPQVGHLVRELVDQRLLEGHFAALAREQLVLGRDLGHQRQQGLAHLLRVQGVELLWGDHRP